MLAEFICLFGHYYWQLLSVSIDSGGRDDDYDDGDSRSCDDDHHHGVVYDMETIIHADGEDDVMVTMSATTAVTAAELCHYHKVPVTFCCRTLIMLQLRPILFVDCTAQVALQLLTLGASSALADSDSSQDSSCRF